MDKRELEQLKRHEDVLTGLVDNAWERMGRDSCYQNRERVEALRYALASVRRDIAAADVPAELKKTA